MHSSVVERGAPSADASAKAHDRVAVNPSEPFGGPYAHAFRKGGNDLNLLFAAQDVHGEIPTKKYYVSYNSLRYGYVN
jgi:hypothetical protein